MHCVSKSAERTSRRVCFCVNEIFYHFSVFGEKLGALGRKRLQAEGCDSLSSQWIHEKQGMKRCKYLEIFHLPGCPNISSHCSVLWSNKKQLLWFTLTGRNGMKEQMWCWLSARLLPEYSNYEMIELSNGILKISYLFIFYHWTEKKKRHQSKHCFKRNIHATNGDWENIVHYCGKDVCAG